MIGGRMRSPFTRFVEQNSAILNEIPSFFLCVHTCLDERNLQVSGQQDKELQQLVTSSAWTPQKSVLLPVGLRLQNNQYSTVANWSDLKIALQAFLIRNDVIMSH
jgi:menaquinone-dependent protoporphyrinogen IX oxidase